MAVPKKRTGHSAQGHRRANCGEPVLTHTVCTACGYYKGKAVSIKSPDYVENTISEKPAKKAKKSAPAPKAEEVVEAKAEIEETKEEVSEESVEKTEE